MFHVIDIIQSGIWLHDLLILLVQWTSLRSRSSTMCHGIFFSCLDHVFSIDLPSVSSCFASRENPVDEPRKSWRKSSSILSFCQLWICTLLSPRLFLVRPISHERENKSEKRNATQRAIEISGHHRRSLANKIHEACPKRFLRRFLFNRVISRDIAWCFWCLV